MASRRRELSEPVPRPQGLRVTSGRSGEPASGRPSQVCFPCWHCLLCDTLRAANMQRSGYTYIDPSAELRVVAILVYLERLLPPDDT